MTADLRLTTTTARGAALVSAVSAALDACAAYESSDDADKSAELYAMTQAAEADVLRLVIDMEGDSARADRAMATVKRAQDQLDAALTLIKTLLGERDAAVATVRVAEQRRAQAESTRDAAQAVASRAEERARKAEQQASDAAGLLIAAERELAEWKGAATFAANAIHEADDAEQWDAVRFVLCAWADTAVEMGGADPLDKGPLDHGREPGRNDEPAEGEEVHGGLRRHAEPRSPVARADPRRGRRDDGHRRAWPDARGDPGRP